MSVELMLRTRIKGKVVGLFHSLRCQSDWSAFFAATERGKSSLVLDHKKRLVLPSSMTCFQLKKKQKKTFLQTGAIN